MRPPSRESADVRPHDDARAVGGTVRRIGVRGRAPPARRRLCSDSAGRHDRHVEQTYDGRLGKSTARWPPLVRRRLSRQLDPSMTRGSIRLAGHRSIRSTAQRPPQRLAHCLSSCRRGVQPWCQFVANDWAAATVPRYVQSYETSPLDDLLDEVADVLEVTSCQRRPSCGCAASSRTAAPMPLSSSANAPRAWRSATSTRWSRPDLARYVNADRVVGHLHMVLFDRGEPMRVHVRVVSPPPIRNSAEIREAESAARVPAPQHPCGVEHTTHRRGARQPHADHGLVVLGPVLPFPPVRVVEVLAPASGVRPDSLQVAIGKRVNAHVPAAAGPASAANGHIQVALACPPLSSTVNWSPAPAPARRIRRNPT